MERTKTYQLCQWEAEDKVQRTDFNEDNAKLEKALAELESDKAEQTALTALAGQVTALEKGQLVYKCDSYTGTGETYTVPNRLEFDFKPLLVIVADSVSMAYGGWPWIRGMESGCSNHPDSGSLSYIRLTWEDRAVQWVNWLDHYGPERQLNIESRVYHYLALGVAE